MGHGTKVFTWNKDEWTPLTEMADGFDEYRPEPSTALAGRSIEFDCVLMDLSDTALSLRHDFDEETVTWTATEGQSGQSGQASYAAFEMQPGLYFIHYRRVEADHPVVVTFALDLTAGQVTGAIGELGQGEHPHLATQQWFQGQVRGTGASRDDAHSGTDELIGRRIRYAYSQEDVYDHVYLNDSIFTWACVSGSEVGQADTDTCTYWKLRDDTYLFSWLEKNLGVEGMVLIDLKALRTSGIQFALDQSSGDLIDITMGAYAAQLNSTPGIDEVRPGPSRANSSA